MADRVNVTKQILASGASSIMGPEPCCNGTGGNQAVDSGLVYGFLSLLTVITAVGTIGNAALCYGQMRTHSPLFFQRILFLNATVAALVSSAVRLAQVTPQLMSFVQNGNAKVFLSYSGAVGNCGFIALALSLAALAFQNLLSIRKYPHLEDSDYASTERSKVMTVLMSALILVGIWMISGCFVILGNNLSPQTNVTDEKPMAGELSSVAVPLALVIQCAMGACIWITVGVTRKIQADFHIHQAQQSLQVRLRVRATMDLTSSIFKVLVLHVVVWLSAIIVNIGASKGLESYLSRTAMERDPNGVAAGNLVVAFAAMVDCISLSFNASYPFLVVWRHHQLQRHMKELLCLCTRRTKVQSIDTAPESITVVGYTTPSPSDPFSEKAPANTAAKVHFNFIEHYWEQVAATVHHGIDPEGCSEGPQQSGV